MNSTRHSNVRQAKETVERINASFGEEKMPRFSFPFFPTLIIEKIHRRDYRFPRAEKQLIDCSLHNNFYVHREHTHLRATSSPVNSRLCCDWSSKNCHDGWFISSVQLNFNSPVVSIRCVSAWNRSDGRWIDVHVRFSEIVSDVDVRSNGLEQRRNHC